MPRSIDRRNQRFGRLRVLCETARDHRGIMWLCQCDCGTEVSVPARQFSGTRPVQSCGCLQREKAVLQGHASAKDRSGEKTGRILILLRLEQRSGRAVYLCRCDCGVEFEAFGGQLRPGGTQSCGCLHRDKMAAFNAANAKHGHTRGSGENRQITPEYYSWRSMLERCRNPKAPNYHLYGGRGITVCDGWKEFKQFLVDMGERPDGTTLDRIDNNGNYEPGNCRWADAKAQSANRRETPALKQARDRNLQAGRRHWPRRKP